MIAGSGALAPIIPPSTNMIVYASLTGFSVESCLWAESFQALLIGFALMGMCYWYARKYNVDAGDQNTWICTLYGSHLRMRFLRS